MWPARTPLHGASPCLCPRQQCVVDVIPVLPCLQLILSFLDSLLLSFVLALGYSFFVHCIIVVLLSCALSLWLLSLSRSLSRSLICSFILSVSLSRFLSFFSFFFFLCCFLSFSFLLRDVRPDHPRMSAGDPSWKLSLWAISSFLTVFFCFSW